LEPYFEDVVRGMFVRLNVGSKPDGSAAYRLAEIMGGNVCVYVCVCIVCLCVLACIVCVCVIYADNVITGVVDYKIEYKFGGHNTRTSLLMKHGKVYLLTNNLLHFIVFHE
jgi:hypothetical protein